MNSDLTHRQRERERGTEVWKKHHVRLVINIRDAIININHPKECNLMWLYLTPHPEE